MPTDVTGLPEGRRPGACAADELLPVVYADLRRLAAAHLSGQRPWHTLQPTALVHEVYLKIAAASDPGWEGRGHFFGAAAMAMREILVDHARRKNAGKRGGGRPALPLEDAPELSAAGASLDEVLAVDEALKRLEVGHPRPAQIVLMRYFAGLSGEEISEALGVTTRTVERDWRFARAWLHAALSGDLA